MTRILIVRTSAIGDVVFASPLARRIAAQKNLDLSTIQGSGPHGRIVKADVEKALAAGPRTAPNACNSKSTPLAGMCVPM